MENQLSQRTKAKDIPTTMELHSVSLSQGSLAHSSSDRISVTRRWVFVSLNVSRCKMGPGLVKFGIYEPELESLNPSDKQAISTP